jgi:hypothetical protein
MGFDSDPAKREKKLNRDEAAVAGTMTQPQPAQPQPAAQTVQDRVQQLELDKNGFTQLKENAGTITKPAADIKKAAVDNNQKIDTAIKAEAAPEKKKAEPAKQNEGPSLKSMAAGVAASMATGAAINVVAPGLAPIAAGASAISLAASAWKGQGTHGAPTGNTVISKDNKGETIVTQTAAPTEVMAMAGPTGGSQQPVFDKLNHGPGFGMGAPTLDADTQLAGASLGGVEKIGNQDKGAYMNELLRLKEMGNRVIANMEQRFRTGVNAANVSDNKLAALLPAVEGAEQKDVMAAVRKSNMMMNGRFA